MKSQFLKRVLAVGLAGSMMLSSFALGTTKAEAKSRGYKSGWNFDIYMCGSDLESGSGQATKDIIEMMKVKDMPGNVRVIIQTGGCSEWQYKERIEKFYEKELGMTEETVKKLDVQNISADYIQRYELKYDNVVYQDGKRITYPALVLLSGNEGVNNPDKATELNVEQRQMGDAAVLEEFVKELDSEYEHNALIFWNHGGGTEDGVCVDEYTGDSLSLVEINEALTGAKGYIPDEKYDMIGYDACLMASFETLAMTAHFADYAAASMTLEAGLGWYYTPIMESLKANSYNYQYTGADLAKTVAQAYYDFYLSDEVINKEPLGEDATEEEWDEWYASGTYDPEAFMGAFDLSKMNSLTIMFDSMAQTMLAINNDANLSGGFVKAGYKAKGIDEKTDLVGMTSFLNETIAYAQKYATKNEGSEDRYISRSVRLCNDYVEKATAFKKAMFEEDFCLKLTLGGEHGRYAGEQGVSLLYPQKDSRNKGDYVNSDYMELGISTYYQMYANNLANVVDAWQSEVAKTSLSYNAKSGKYNFKLLTNNLDFLYFFGNKAYIMRNGKERLVRYCDKDRSSKELSLSPISVYYTFNGEPIFWDELDDYGYHETYVSINGGEIETGYVKKESKGYRLALDTVDLEPGDTIAPVKIEDGDYKVVKKAAYKVKAGDLENGNAIVPIQRVKDTKGELKNAFVAMNTVGDITRIDVVHKDIIAFSTAKASLSKKVFKATGAKICPKVTVKNGKKTLKKGKDYKLVYENNLGAGKATVKVVGIGKYQYAPVKTLHFTIKLNK